MASIFKHGRRWRSPLTAPAWTVDLPATQRAWALVDVDAPALTAGRAVLLVGVDGPGRLAAMISEA